MDTTKEIYINSTIGSTRIAILEDKILCDLHIERPEHQRMVGNIYKGKVQNVIPGMQAAFIDIGYDVNAFLPFTEIIEKNSVKDTSFDKDNSRKTTNKNIEVNLEIGDDILVQVIKEPFSGKGPRVTSDISISGNLLVLVPNQKYIGISKKIRDKYEKSRLREIVKSIKPKNFGIIVRTISLGKNQKTINNDLNKMMNEWANTKSRIDANDAPFLVHNDYNIPNIIIRDLMEEHTNKVTLDNKSLYKTIYSYIKETSPDQMENVTLYNSKMPIFDKHNIEEQISKSLKNKIWLKSGSYLIMDHTEAMLVVDVNSGRYIGKGSHEENSLKINLEAAIEITKQLRIRDIGGLVVIDFIDLLNIKNRKKVYEELKRRLKKDRAKVSVSEFSEFGLVQMTRQRIGLSLLFTLTDQCDKCRGLGRIDSKDSVLTKIENWLKRFKIKYSDKRLIIYVNESMNEYILQTKKKAINKLIFKNWIWIDLKIDSELSNSEYRIFSRKRKKDVTNEV